MAGNIFRQYPPDALPQSTTQGLGRTYNAPYSGGVIQALRRPHGQPLVRIDIHITPMTLREIHGGAAAWRKNTAPDKEVRNDEDMDLVGCHDLWRMDGSGVAGYIATDALGRDSPSRTWIHIPRERFDSFEEDLVSLLAEHIRRNPEAGGSKSAY